MQNFIVTLSWHLSDKLKHYDQSSQQIIESCHLTCQLGALTEENTRKHTIGFQGVTSSEEGEPILLDPDPAKYWHDICTVLLGTYSRVFCCMSLSGFIWTWKLNNLPGLYPAVLAFITWKNVIMSYSHHSMTKINNHKNSFVQHET